MNRMDALKKIKKQIKGRNGQMDEWTDGQMDGQKQIQ